MSIDEKPSIGAILWHDLTIPDAESTRKFYSEVVGWKSEPVDMGGYNDFNMNAPDTGKTIAGICYARGQNAKLPPQWLIYINVADVDEAAKKCVKMGGKVIDGPKPIGPGRVCVIQDPAGAYAALYRA